MKFIHTTEFWTRKSVEADKIRVYVFGDNMDKAGMAGQACIRGLDNAYGIPTKVHPCTSNQSCYFSDHSFQENCRIIQQAFNEIPNTTVVVNVNIGRGLAQMHETAPKTYKFLCDLLKIPN